MEPVIDPGLTPGRRIKLYRTRRGLTQEACAQLMGVSVGAWRKWEYDERPVTALATWIQIARVLGVRDLHRLTGLNVGDLPDEPSEHATVAPIRAAMHTYAPPAMTDQPTTTGLAQAIDFAWQAWHGSPHRFSRTGPLLPDLILTGRALAHTQDTPTTHKLLTNLYLLVRAYARRVGAPDVAQLAAERGLVAAHHTADPDYIAAATWSSVTVLGNHGNAELAASLATDAINALQQATGDTDPTPHRLAVMGALNLMLAAQHAHLLDERRALDALDVAATAAAITGETNHHHLVFGPTNVGIFRATVALELSRAGEARRIAERIDVTPLPSLERRFTHYLSLAGAYAADREDLAAATMLSRAHGESGEEAKLNPVYRATIRDLLTRETPTTRPTLRPLADAVGIV